MERRQKDIKGPEDTIAQHESNLGRARVQPEGTLASDDDHSDSGAEDATASVADDTPSRSAMSESLAPPPGEEQTHSMEVDDSDDHQPPVSPVSSREDGLLTGGDAAGV